MVYPNPSSGKFRLELKENNFSSPVIVEISDVLGEIIYKSELPSSSSGSEIDLAGNSQRIYFYRLANTAGTVGEGKIILE